MTLPFSLLLPVYAGDHPDYLREAFRSAVHDQTLRPDEVVLVQDGPVGTALEAALAELRDGSPVPVRHVVLERNEGLAVALTVGLSQCAHDVIARMDADDIAEPDRFERQLPLMDEFDLVGSGMHEFDETGEIVFTRTPPTGDAIADAARLVDPFNHPTVVYRRHAVLEAGGYLDLPLMEDYWLFARMIASGARVENVPEPLVRYRIGAGAYRRRGGLRQLRSELLLQRRLRAAGFTTRGQFLRNVLVRGFYRLVPTAVRRALYRRFINRRRPQT